MNTYNLKIYVVISDFPYEDTIINKVYINEDDAKNELNRLKEEDAGHFWALYGYEIWDGETGECIGYVGDTYDDYMRITHPYEYPKWKKEQEYQEGKAAHYRKLAEKRAKKGK